MPQTELEVKTKKVMWLTACFITYMEMYNKLLIHTNFFFSIRILVHLLLTDSNCFVFIFRSATF